MEVYMGSGNGKGNHNNAARKKTPAEIAAEVDEGWDLEPEVSEKQKAAQEEFIFTEGAPQSTEAIQKGVSKDIEKARTEIMVSAEDTFAPGEELFMKTAEKEDIDYPSMLHIVSGANTPSSKIYMPFESGVVCASTLSGTEKATNHDGVLAHYDEARKRLRVMLARGPQHDEQAANVATAAVVKGAIEEATHPDEKVTDMARSIFRNIEGVKKEFGIEQKEQAVLLAELKLIDRAESNSFHDLSVVNLGTSHCLIVDPDNGEFQEVLPRMKRIVTRAELKNLYDTMEGSLAEKAELLMQHLEQDALTKKGGKSMRNHVEFNELEEGLGLEKIVDVLAEFFEDDLAQKIQVLPGEIVVIVSDEIVQSMPVDEKKTAYVSLANEITLGVHTPSKGLRGACDAIVAHAEKLQGDGKISDSSLSIIAFEVPVKKG